MVSARTSSSSSSSSAKILLAARSRAGPCGALRSLPSSDLMTATASWTRAETAYCDESDNRFTSFHGWSKGFTTPDGSTSVSHLGVDTFRPKAGAVLP